MIAGNQIWFDLRTSLTSLSFPCYSPGCFFLFVVLPSTQCFFLFLVDGRYEIWIPKWRQHNTWYIYIHTHKKSSVVFKNLPTKGWCFICKPKKPTFAPSAKNIWLINSTMVIAPGIRSRSKSVSWKQNHSGRWFPDLTKILLLDGRNPSFTAPPGR